MNTGRIVDAPTDYSVFARVRDERGEEYTVHGSEMPESPENGDDFAYMVDVWQNRHGNVTTLRWDFYDPDR